MSAADGLTLALDASTYAGSVCVARGGVVLAEETVQMRDRDEERLLPAVARALEAAGAAPPALARVVCGAGPGSFTSLRIAASVAKGIAAGRALPLFAVSSLALIAAGAPPSAGRCVAVLDALRGECYAAACETDAAGRVLSVGEAMLRPLAWVEAREAAGERVAGPGRALDVAPHARAVVRVEALLAAPVPLDAWEPDYGRLAEAQVKWEAAHGRKLVVG